MNKLTEQRYIEVQLYKICFDIISIRNQITDVMNIIEALSDLGGYDSELLKLAAQEILVSLYAKPQRKEFILLLKEAGIRPATIKRNIKVSSDKLYDILKNPDPETTCYPRLKDFDHDEIHKFIKAFSKIQRSGIQ